MKTPMPHQIAGAEFIAVRKRAALWFLPRVGKTLTTILAMERLKAKRVLILCPKSVQQGWVDELAERNHFATKAHNSKPNGDLLVATYEMAWRGTLPQQEWDLVVFDESIKLANWNSKQASVWYNLPKHTAVVLLSGAPCPEGYIQLANQMIICRGVWFGHRNIWSYIQEYWRFDKEKFKWKCDFPGHLTECGNRMRVIGMSMSREDLGLKDKKFFSYLRIPADKVQLSLAKEINKSDKLDTHKAMYLQMLGSGFSQDKDQVSSAKIDTIAEYVRDKLATEPNFRVVVMCRFSQEIPLIAQALNAPFIDGSVTGQARDQIIKGFQSDKYKHIVCQVVVAKMGIDLSKARTIIYASNSWSGDDRIQSQERCTNITKHDPVEIIDCVVEGQGFGIDYAVAEAVKNKKDFNLNLLRN